MRKQKWNHLSGEQKAVLKSAILDNHELFILDKSKLGLMKGPPAKINVADSQLAVVLDIATPRRQKD